MRPLRGGNSVQCNARNAPFHEKCFYSSTVKPEDGVGPCCLEGVGLSAFIYLSVDKFRLTCILLHANHQEPKPHN